MVLGIEHTAIVSPDPDRLAAWYVSRLGFRINYHSEATRTHFVRAENGSMLEIILADGAPRGTQNFRDVGIRHLAIVVDDFEGEYARLQAAGVEFLTEPERKKGTSVVFFSDPDGNYLHLIQRERPLP